MSGRGWRAPSAPMVISCIALFVALSGSAVALQGKNTVDSGDIKPSAVKTADVADQAITSTKVDANAISSSDIEDGTVLGRDIGPIDVVRVAQFHDGNGFATAIAQCPPGRRLIGGGAKASNGTMHLFRNGPYYPGDDEFSGGTPRAWIGTATSPGAGFENVIAYAICLQ
jgi:hypothetical protein